MKGLGSWVQGGKEWDDAPQEEQAQAVVVPGQIVRKVVLGVSVGGEGSVGKDEVGHPIARGGPAEREEWEIAFGVQGGGTGSL